MVYLDSVANRFRCECICNASIGQYLWIIFLVVILVLQHIMIVNKLWITCMFAWPYTNHRTQQSTCGFRNLLVKYCGCMPLMSWDAKHGLIAKACSSITTILWDVPVCFQDGKQRMIFVMWYCTAYNSFSYYIAICSYSLFFAFVYGWKLHIHPSLF